MPAHVVCPTLSTMCSELLSGRPRAESGVDDDRYVRLLAVDPVLRSISRVDGLGPDRLRSLGLSRAKAAAIVGLARMHLDGTLDLDGLDDLDDAQVVHALTAARGVGLWTAQMFLIHQLRRSDVLPAGDLGIRQAVRAAWALPALPRIEEVRQRGERWSPYRTYAAALLWASLRSGPDR